jgi:hypothetical protein
MLTDFESLDDRDYLPMVAQIAQACRSEEELAALIACAQVASDEADLEDTFEHFLPRRAEHPDKALTV